MSITIQTKYLPRENWPRVPESRFTWTELDAPGFSGAAGLTHIVRAREPLTVSGLGKTFTIVDSGYYWLQLAPRRAHWWLTVAFNERKQPVQCYFDITRRNVIQGRDSCFEDLMLDVVALPEGGCMLMDRDELDAALAAGNITPEEHRLACESAQELLDALPERSGELMDFCSRTLERLLAQMDAEG